MLTIEELSYRTISSINPLYLIINKTNGYIEESNANRYLTLVPTDEIKDTLERYEKTSEIFLDQYLVTKTIMMRYI